VTPCHPSSVERQSQNNFLRADNGTGQIKAGFADDESFTPKVIFPNVVGRPKQKGVRVGAGKRDLYVKDDAMAKR